MKKLRELLSAASEAARLPLPPGPAREALGVFATARLLVGILVLTVVAFAPLARPSDRWLAVALTAGWFVPVAVFAFVRRHDPTWSYRLATLIGDLTSIALFQLVVPSTRISALIVLNIILVSAVLLSGAIAGAMVVVVGTGSTFLTQIANPRAPVVDFPTLMIASAALVSLFALTEIATREQRRRASSEAHERISEVSHELRTPLTSIVGFAHTLLDRWSDLDDIVKQQLLMNISANARQLEGMTTHLVHEGHEQVAHPPTETNLLDLVRSCILLYGPSLLPHPVTLNISDTMTVAADEYSLMTVIRNLLSNAAKYSPGSEPIEINARTHAGRIVVSIRDHGRGIDPEEAAAIFEPYVRGSASPGQEGVGVGLSIVRRHLDQMGSEIRVISTPGDGATFEFTLEPAPRSG